MIKVVIAENGSFISVRYYLTSFLIVHVFHLVLLYQSSLIFKTDILSTVRKPDNAAENHDFCDILCTFNFSIITRYIVARH